MRPLRLTLKGFTAFRDEQTLDFTDLDVFAVSGPTGSGKSSLLDAMTFALYGKVERVGTQVGQLISQGQPAMAVEFDFAVGDRAYRVTRRAQAKGPTKILLAKRSSDGSWEQAGEGADRVRDVNAMIEETVGLSYEGFTRSVLLPQGRFQEFLVGEPKKRREILTELLGLSLFGRMAARANSIAKEAGVRSDTLTGMLEQDFADVTGEAVQESEAAAAVARTKERALVKAARDADRISARWDEARRSVADLRGCCREASDAASKARAEAGELIELAEGAAAAQAVVARCREAAAGVQAAHDVARAALERHEAGSGSAKELADARLAAHRLAEAATARASAATLLASTLEVSVALVKTRDAAALGVTAATKHRAARERDLATAQEVHEQAKHADLVAAVSVGLGVGDPCPVCGSPLAEAPAKPAARELAAAAKVERDARAALEAAARSLSNAERAADRAERDLESNAAERERLEREVGRFEAALREQREALAALLAGGGGGVPDDPVAGVDRLIAERERLVAEERAAATAVSDAGRALLEAEQDRERVLARLEGRRAAVVADHRGLLDRAARAFGDGRLPITLPAAPAPTGGAEGTDGADGARALAAHAEAVSAALEDLASSLEAEVAERSGLEASLIEELVRAVAGLVEPSPSLEEFARAIHDARHEAAASAATAGQRASDLAARLRRKEDVLQEVAALDRRARVFRALANELRDNRLVAYLQEEALHLLAAAGSDRLRSISDGRYRLVCRSDEFLVVDTWNADEERSVRTLSGGETFLASLSLALALADQHRSLSTTDRARLDSLFLDEGFGTLDQEALRTVVEAIGQLGHDGRLVGIITHVRELAEEFSRIEVEKSPQGSRLRLVSA